MRRHLLLMIATASCTLLACGSSRPTEAAPDAPAPALTTSGGERVKPADAKGPEPAASAPDAAPAKAAAGEVKVGTIEFEAIPRAKSVRAYTGAELFLRTASERITLRPTEAVDRDRLLGLDNRRVQLRVEWMAGHPPAEGASAPTGPDGDPLPQGAGWRVLAVEEEL